MAQSIDGHTIEENGRWALGTKEDKRRMDHLRNWADCIIASRRSISNDNPNLFIRNNPKSKNHPFPVVIIHDLNKKIQPDRRIFSKPHPPGEFWVFADTPPSIAEIIEKNKFSESQHGKWKVKAWKNINEIKRSMVDRGFRKILLEGGPSLNGVFLKNNLIDEIFFTIVPYVWAGNSTDRLITSADFIERNNFRLVNVERRNDEVFFRYKKTSSNTPSN